MNSFAVSSTGISVSIRMLSLTVTGFCTLRFFTFLTETSLQVLFERKVLKRMNIPVTISYLDATEVLSMLSVFCIRDTFVFMRPFSMGLLMKTVSRRWVKIIYFVIKPTQRQFL